MKTITLVLACLLAEECGCAQPPPLVPTPLPAKPTKGDKVVIEKKFYGEVWDGLEIMRKSMPMRVNVPVDNYKTPEFKAVFSHVIASIKPGDLVEVLDVGDDYIEINLVRGEGGEAINKHGYTLAWWKPHDY